MLLACSCSGLAFFGGKQFVLGVQGKQLPFEIQAGPLRTSGVAVARCAQPNSLEQRPVWSGEERLLSQLDDKARNVPGLTMNRNEFVISFLTEFVISGFT